MTQCRKALSYQAARVRALGKRRGGTWVRARIWDWEFKAGRWDFLQHTEEDPFYALLIGKLDGGRLLDLGCGSGTVRCELPPDSMSRYVGVDISAEAIRQAEQRTSSFAGLPEGQLFVAGSIADPVVLSGVGDDFDVILMRESLYFVEVDTVPRFLAGLGELLSPRGVVLIRIHDRERYSTHVEATRRALHVLEEQKALDGKSIFIVATRPESR